MAEERGAGRRFSNTPASRRVLRHHIELSVQGVRSPPPGQEAPLHQGKALASTREIGRLARPFPARGFQIQGDPDRRSFWTPPAVGPRFCQTAIKTSRCEEMADALKRGGPGPERSAALHLTTTCARLPGKPLPREENPL